MSESPRLCLIVAIAKNGVIGKDGGLPWRLPEDMKWFKETTMGKPILMGRNTWESLPKKPLPGRTNIVLTGQKDYVADGAVVVHDYEAAVEAAKQAAREAEADEVMIIGGAQVYKMALPDADRLYLTEVHAAIDGDTIFPDYDKGGWAETKRDDRQPEAGPAYSFVVLERKG